MKHFTLWLFSALFLLFHFEAKGQLFAHLADENKIHFQAGYTFSAYNVGAGNSLSFGICKIKTDKGGSNDGPLSSIPLLTQIYSANAVGLLTDQKFYPGLKIGYEAQFIFLAGRIEMTAFPQYVFVTPSAGISFLYFGSLMAGYNISVTDSKKSGFQISCNLNFGSL